MEGGHPPALLAIPDDAEALKRLAMLEEMTDARKWWASMKNAVFKGI